MGDTPLGPSALRENELGYRAILETIPGLIVVTTPVGALEYANRQCLEYFDTTLADMTSMYRLD
jgi:PAS domain-containing protein